MRSNGRRSSGQTRPKITHWLRYRAAVQLILIAHLEETRIRVDEVCPKQFHHRRHLVGPKVFAVRELFASRLRFIVPEWGAPGCGVYVAPVGLWAISLGETSN